MIVALTSDDNRLVVTKEFRVPIGGYEYGLPAGLIDGKESPHDTAIRELEEETGMEFVGFIKGLSPLVYNSPGMTNEGVYMAYAWAKGEPNTKGNEASEDIEVLLLSRDEVKKLMDRRDLMIGAKAWMVFDRFVEHGDV